MIDIHSHLLPGVDDGAPHLEAALEMARAYAAQGVDHVVCTPHILPGRYYNSGPSIREAVISLQRSLEDAGIPLKLSSGADNHVVPNFVAELRRGHLLPVAGSDYVLVEPPHHVAPLHIDKLFFDISLGGFVPILTHPERLHWIESKYDLIVDLARKGVWMQITAGSIYGHFGSRPRYWAERMMAEGIVHVIATDAHSMAKRPPDLDKGLSAAAKIVGEIEAEHMVLTRPRGIVENTPPNTLPQPAGIRPERSEKGQSEEKKRLFASPFFFFGKPH